MTLVSDDRETGKGSIRRGQILQFALGPSLPLPLQFRKRRQVSATVLGLRYQLRVVRKEVWVFRYSVLNTSHR